MCEEKQWDNTSSVLESKKFERILLEMKKNSKVWLLLFLVFSSSFFFVFFFLFVFLYFAFLWALLLLVLPLLVLVAASSFSVFHFQSFNIVYSRHNFFSLSLSLHSTTYLFSIHNYTNALYVCVSILCHFVWWLSLFLFLT